MSIAEILCRRLFLIGLIGSGGVGILRAQSYQTNFAAESFDRGSYSPTLNKSGVTVDPASGVVGLNFLLGPGIGPKNMKFIPGVRGAIRPEGYVQQGDASYGSMFYSSGPNVSPGYIDLNVSKSLGPGGFMIRQAPNGILGNGKSFSFDTTKSISSPFRPATDVSTLFSSFGYDTNLVVTLAPTDIGKSTPQFDGSTSDGNLIVGLRRAGTNNPSVNGQLYARASYKYGDTQPYSIIRVDTLPTTVPPIIVVISGDQLFEYSFHAPKYTSGESGSFTGTDPTTQKSYTAEVWSLEFLLSLHYRLTGQYDRFGNKIIISYGSNGISYTAEWFKNNLTTGVKIHQGDLAVTYFDASGAQGQSYSIGYTMAPNPWASLEYGPSPDYLENAFFGDIRDPKNQDRTLSIFPTSIMNNGSGETIKINYDAAPQVSYGNAVLSPQVISSITLPSGLSMTFAYNSYDYRRNLQSDGRWSGYTGSVAQGGASNWVVDFSWGVTAWAETGGGQKRSTLYERHTPRPNWTTATSWSNTDFYTIVTHPDNTSTLHRYMSPVNGNSGGPQQTMSVQMQTLSHLKQVETETREYAAGVDPKADVNSSVSASTAYRTTLFDRWDIRGTTNRYADLNATSTPYPTRVRLWDDRGIYSEEELLDWDLGNAGWKTHRKIVGGTASNPPTSTEMVSAEIANTSSTPGVSGVGTFDLTESCTYTSVPAQYLWAQLMTQSRPAQPLLTNAWDSNNLLAKSILGDSTLQVISDFTYQNGILQNVKLSSPQPLGNQGMGATYTPDALGFINQIQLSGTSAWSLHQTNDAFGRPLTQLDANSLITNIGWDVAGRLHSIAPPGDYATTYDYTPDSTGATVTVTHGLQQSQLRYNPFGELVLESRTSDGTNWSNKTYGYDLGGRKVWEWIWLTGQGDPTKWSQPLQSGQILVGAGPGHYENDCRDYDSNGNCIKPIRIWFPGPPIYGSISGTLLTYDSRGRLITSVDPNGVQTSIAFSGLTKTVTVGTTHPATTVFTSDLLGRLAQVRDANNQITTYQYDLSDRLLSVQQSDPQDPTRRQTRQWTYNTLGWLTQLIQPESGTTTYSSFTIAGKPQTTVYGDGSPNPVSILRQYDQIGRLLNLTGPSVVQGFAYDEVGHGLGLNKMTSSVDGTSGSAVQLNYTYDSLGRLGTLKTTFQGMPTLIVQDFTYNAYGQRNGGDIDGRPWSLTFYEGQGLPKDLYYGTARLATATYLGDSWGLKSLNYGNGVLSQFQYSMDQARVNRITHFPLVGNPLSDWNYSFDDRGNLIQVDDFADVLNIKSDYFAYDALDRLVSSDVLSTTYGEQYQSFGYDAFGNRTASSIQSVLSWSGIPFASTPSTVPSPLISAGKATNLTLDASNSTLWMHNQIPLTTSSGAITGAIYDNQGNLKQISPQPGGTPITMQYDALGRVVQLSSNVPGSPVERYHYTPDGLRTVVEEFQSGVLVRMRINLYNDQRQLVSQYVLQ